MSIIFIIPTLHPSLLPDLAVGDVHDVVPFPRTDQDPAVRTPSISHSHPPIHPIPSIHLPSIHHLQPPVKCRNVRERKLLVAIKTKRSKQIQNRFWWWRQIRCRHYNRMTAWRENNEDIKKQDMCAHHGMKQCLLCLWGLCMRSRGWVVGAELEEIVLYSTCIDYLNL